MTHTLQLLHIIWKQTHYINFLFISFKNFICSIFWSYSPPQTCLRSPHIPAHTTSCSLYPFSKRWQNIRNILTKNDLNLCWPCDENGFCLEVWLIYPVSVHWRKIYFSSSCSFHFFARGRTWCITSLRYGRIFVGLELVKVISML